MAAVDRLYKENSEGLRQLAKIESEERDWRHYVTLIGLEIESTIPSDSNIETLDAVKLLVREVNSLREAIGLKSYKDLASDEGD